MCSKFRNSLPNGWILRTTEAGIHLGGQPFPVHTVIVSWPHQALLKARWIRILVGNQCLKLYVGYNGCDFPFPWSFRTVLIFEDSLLTPSPGRHRHRYSAMHIAQRMNVFLTRKQSTYWLGVMMVLWLLSFRAVSESARTYQRLDGSHRISALG